MKRYIFIKKIRARVEIHTLALMTKKYNYLDNLNDIFYLLNKCEKNEKTISELLEFPVVKSPFKRLN